MVVLDRRYSEDQINQMLDHGEAEVDGTTVYRTVNGRYYRLAVIVFTPNAEDLVRSAIAAGKSREFISRLAHRLAE